MTSGLSPEDSVNAIITISKPQQSDDGQLRWIEMASGTLTIDNESSPEDAGIGEAGGERAGTHSRIDVATAVNDKHWRLSSLNGAIEVARSGERGGRAKVERSGRRGRLWMKLQGREG